MAEYMWAKIEIGGEISHPILTHLIEKFGISPEADHYLELENAEAAWGQFEELETYFVEQAIPFNRVSDGRYEYSPESRKYRPRLTDADGNVLQPETDHTFLCDHDNRPMVALVDVDKVIAETSTQEELVAFHDRKDSLISGHFRAVPGAYRLNGFYPFYQERPLVPLHGRIEGLESRHFTPCSR